MAANAIPVESILSIDPATGNILGQFEKTLPVSLPEILSRARAAQSAWCVVPIEQRCAHLRVLREHTDRDLFDYVLVNRVQPTAAQLAPYRSEGAEFLRCEGHLPSAGGAELIEADLLDTTCDKVRHDGAKLAAVILDLAQRWRHPLYDQARPAVAS